MKQKHIDRAPFPGYAETGQVARASAGKPAVGKVTVPVNQTQTGTEQRMQPGVLKSYFQDIVDEPSEVVKNTQLVRAAASGDITWVQELVNKDGVDVRTGDDRPLRIAAANGHAKIVKILLQNGADVHAMDDAALREAAKTGYDDVVSVLLESGANVHARGDEAQRLANEHSIQTSGPFDARQSTPAGGHDNVIKLLSERPPSLKR